MMSMLALVIIRPLQIAKHALNHNHLFFLNLYVHLFARFATNTYSKSGENREQANSDRNGEQGNEDLKEHVNGDKS